MCITLCCVSSLKTTYDIVIVCTSLLLLLHVLPKKLHTPPISNYAKKFHIQAIFTKLAKIMLEPVSPSPQAHQLSTAEKPRAAAQASHRGGGPSSPNLWEWVRKRELAFVFLVCSLGVLLFRTKDSLMLAPVWRESLQSTTAADSDSLYYEDML